MSQSNVAKQCFNDGYNCAQSVLVAFCEALELDKSVALKMTTGMGGGMRTGDVCGAVTGGAMVLGLKYGVDDSMDEAVKAEKKVLCHKLTKEFKEAFSEIYSSTQCKDILGYDLTVEEEMKAIQDKALFTKVCPQVVADAAAIIESLIETY